MPGTPVLAEPLQKSFHALHPELYQETTSGKLQNAMCLAAFTVCNSRTCGGAEIPIIVKSACK